MFSWLAETADYCQVEKKKGPSRPRYVHRRNGKIRYENGVRNDR